MKLQFLGTGAADWTVKDRENPEYRRNASALVDGVLLIDPGPCVPDALETFGVDVNKIRFVINTHRHGDHYNEDTLAWLQAKGAQFVPLAAGETAQLGPYTVQALAGNHATCPGTVHFIISDGEKRLFYGLDGAWLLYEEYQALKNGPVDYAVLDATVGHKEGDFRIFEHNDLRMVAEMKLTLAPYVGQFCISHMARTLHTDHATLAADMEKLGFETAFDGMVADF